MLIIFFIMKPNYSKTFLNICFNRISFTKLNPLDLDKKYSFDMKVENDKFQVFNCNPPIIDENFILQVIEDANTIPQSPEDGVTYIVSGMRKLKDNIHLSSFISVTKFSMHFNSYLFI